MRTFLFSFLAISSFTAPLAGATRNFGITDFTKVRVEGPYKVTLTTGVPPSARAIGSPAALDRVAIEVRGDTLVVHTDTNAWGGYPGADPGTAEIEIGTHDLSSAALTGAGSVAINRVSGLSFGLSVFGSGSAQIADVAVDQFTASLAGTTSVKLIGSVKRFTASVRGLSALDAGKLTSPATHVTAEGSGTVDAVATDNATVEASGPATIRLSGNPSCQLTVHGSASVSGCK